MECTQSRTILDFQTKKLPHDGLAPRGRHEFTRDDCPSHTVRPIRLIVVPSTQSVFDSRTRCLADFGSNACIRYCGWCVHDALSLSSSPQSGVERCAARSSAGGDSLGTDEAILRLVYLHCSGL